MPSIKLTRRDFLKLSGASAALAASACSSPLEPIVPYARQPESTLPGIPRFYATAAEFTGAAEGMLVESNTGRPTKVEGNPFHAGSLGGTSVQGQASVLQLWDPERSKAPRRKRQPATRTQFELELNEALAKLEQRSGEGLRILIGTVTSPTLLRQLDEVRERLPRAAIHRWDPLHRDNSREGARLAFGRPLEPLYALDTARTILSLDSRLFEEHPYRLAYARQVSHARIPRDGSMCRIYAIESAPSLIGAFADHRLAMPAPEIENWLVGRDERYQAIWKDLHQTRGVIVAGEALPPRVHAWVHRLNQELTAPVRYIEAADRYTGPCAKSIAELVADINGGGVEVLLILEGNPAYDAPAELRFANALANAPLSIHLSLYEDETSMQCTWHLPATHFMEHWSDARAFDGTACVVQPLIAPLYESSSSHELLSLLLRRPAKGYDIVRATWRESDWSESLRKGFIAGTQFAPVKAIADEIKLHPQVQSTRWHVRFVADQSVLDGRFANNPWLQELPRSDSKLTWDNAALLSPASAREAGIETGDVIELSVGERRLRAPAWISPTHAARSITLPLGYGRTRAGGVGNRVGFDAYALRTGDSPWSAPGVQVAKTGERHSFATTQEHSRMEGRDLAKTIALAGIPAQAKAEDSDTPQVSLYSSWPYDGYRWGMHIDLNACIGCNACTIACQAENNIPTVGKDQVIVGREMHWIRVDRYYEETPSGLRTLYQPVACMQCENAPCEYVCPVEASVHDSEGLNVQVYNRCVGTRFCSQNCPYKVRRFNFLHYSRDDDTLKLQRNPEVTVRRRGVMEKCTYCVQRISHARIEAEKADRRIHDGEVVTACQAACPTQAITFGDLNDRQSAIHAAKQSPRAYDLLAELNTRPRTSYAARVIHRNRELRDE